MKKILLIFGLLAVLVPAYSQDQATLAALEMLALGEGSQAEILEELSDLGDPYIKTFIGGWRTGEVYSYTISDSETIVLLRVSEKFRRLSDNEIVDLAEDDSRLKKIRPARKLRKLLKTITDTIDLSSPDSKTRIDAALKLGLSQNTVYLEALQKKLQNEENEKVRLKFEEAINISLLANAEGPEALLSAIVRLGELKSLPSRDGITNIQNKAIEAEDEDLVTACTVAVGRIDRAQKTIERWGNLVRGLSTGSVLLMVAFGLAITFGLMGIINMAHGEFLAIGGYTCYVVQNIFANAFGVQSAAYQWFFWVSIPISFVVAGAIGFGLEKGMFRFLYKRPLESLLATWGLSMIMQQLFRLNFGAANVQVNTPDVLIGNLEVAGVALSYTRIFVIAFAGVVIVMTWLLLSKTNLGLYIRSVMQNRNMASSLGIPVSRVNSLTFAFGCGLAALAGAALSQIGNVGPSMGQTYIVDSFMVVVVGGVGNLLGAGISAMGIGAVDQFLQPYWGPVMGKIIVYFVIILFLQWKPGGLFPTKSRSMDD
ncbi:urea ABC transporter permease subunit UrtB [Puniceicoccaceae bacterium K14]|nr:urea ABC transporter permease subunit UrtB [Puniceicoccaceae bacterium K14]